MNSVEIQFYIFSRHLKHLIKLSTRFAGLALLAFYLTLPAASSSADTFDWNNITYAPAVSTTTTKFDLGTVNGNTISIQFGNNAYFSNSTLNGGSPASPASASYTGSNYYTSGSSANTTASNSQKSLQIIADFANNTQSIPVTIFFSKPVVNVSFSFFDVDNGTFNNGGYNDQIRNILATTTASTSIDPSTLTPTAGTNQATGTNAVTAIGNSGQNSAAGNAGVAFTSGAALTGFGFTYGDTYAGTAAHSTLQIIALSNITFTTVPEPGTTAMLALGALGAGLVAFRRRRA